jgi:hypothetical protein
MLQIPEDLSIHKVENPGFQYAVSEPTEEADYAFSGFQKSLRIDTVLRYGDVCKGLCNDDY